MKNIDFYFGYLGQSKWSKFIYNLCKKFPFIPTIEIRLFRTYFNSEAPFPIRHSFCLGFMKWYWRLEKVKRKWRFENLTDK